MRKYYLFIGIMLFLILISYRGKSQELTIQTIDNQKNAEIPTQFKSLYQEIEKSIDNASRIFSFVKNNQNTLFAPELFLAGSNLFKPKSQSWKDLLSTIDAFKSMKMNAVSVVIASPDLTIGDSVSIINFYQQLVKEIHSRNMKIYVEYFDNPPFSPHAHKVWQDTPEGRKDFLSMKEKEVSIIYHKIRPDFLSIITEPSIMMRWTHLNFSASELAKWVGEVTTHLKSSGEISKTLLGAGAGTWEPADFVINFVNQKSLDYIDIHMYALKASVYDNAVRFDSLVHQIRKLRSHMMINIGETWLFKHDPKEPLTTAAHNEAFFRDNFSFWSPLDQKYMKLIIRIAQNENVTVVVPYFSQYFFTYYNFGDVEANQLPQWPSSVINSWNKAIEAIHNQQRSETGKAIFLMLNK